MTFCCEVTLIDNDELALVMKELKQNIVRREKPDQIMHGRLLQMATSAVTKNGSESEDFAQWEEPYKQARKWTPCAAKHSLADEELHVFSSDTRIGSSRA